MTGQNLGLSGPERNPVVHVKAGKVFANSRDVAAFFGKRHDNVIRDIASVMAETKDWGVLNFEECSYISELQGIPRSYRCYDMTKNGFTYLVQGYTGAKAAAFKIAYIEQFDAMEDEMRRRVADPLRALNDPAALRDLLLNYSEKVSELQDQIAAQAPVMAAFDRIAGAEGSMCVTDAAKALQVQPKVLFAWLRANKWIYGRPGHAGWIAYQDKIQTGHLGHKVTTLTRNDGTDKTVEQVRITPSGLAKLAKVVPGANLMPPKSEG